MNKEYEEIIKKLTVEEMIALLAGVDDWHTAAVERLGIPSIKVTDGPYGARTITDGKRQKTLPATCFPTGVAMAASWDPALIRRIGETLGEETRERGCAVLLGPCVNIHRSPLGGRNFESFSEDPFLSGSLAAAFVKGVQSRQVGVSVKHFALNNQEFARFTSSSEASERAIREIYFPAFKKAVKEGGAWTVMCSYNKINGRYASENHWLLTEILKGEWGFDGLVISDWFATHSAIPAAEAGLDLEMPGPARFMGPELVKAVKEGEISRTLIEDKVRRLLKLIERCEGFSHPPGPPQIRNTAARRKLAGEAAAASIVLLKNEAKTLPLNLNRIRSIAVIGPNAAAARATGGGSSRVVPHYTVSPLEGIRRICGKKVKVRWARGCRANRLTGLLVSRYLTTAVNGGQPGLQASCFASEDFSGPAVWQYRETQWSRMWLDDEIKARKGVKPCFSTRWTGFFKAPLAGRYRFGLVTEGRARIIINGKEIVSTAGTPQTSGFDISEEVCGECELAAGSINPISLEYARNPGPGGLPRRLRAGCNIPETKDWLAEAVELAARSDAVVICGGLNEEFESEGFDRKDMDLPAPQPELIRAVTAVNPRTIVVLNNGSPVTLSGWSEKVPAIVESWFGGQEGGNAVAEVLFGRVNPAGKLPDTFPRRLEDNPAYTHYPGSKERVEYAEDILVGYRHYDQNQIEPFYPFGYGLSYTTFEYNRLSFSTPVMTSITPLRIKALIRNSGRRQGSEVVQLYLRDIESSQPRPPKELKGFLKVKLKPGQTTSVDFELNEESLAFFDPLARRWKVEPGEFEVLLGSSSRDIRLSGRFRYQEV